MPLARAKYNIGAPEPLDHIVHLTSQAGSSGTFLFANRKASAAGGGGPTDIREEREREEEACWVGGGALDKCIYVWSQGLSRFLCGACACVCVCLCVMRAYVDLLPR